MTGRTGTTSIQYSYCLTTKNCVRTIEKCLKSIFDNNDRNIEVIVVDSHSRDGTAEVLEKYSKEIRLVSAECTRGKGRQIAFENATGRYIITLDADMVLRSAVRRFLSVYHARYEGLAFLLMEWNTDFRIHSTPFFITPATLVREAGGWRDIQVGEDDDLWSRLAAMGKFRFTYRNPLVVHMRERSTRLAGIKDAYYHHEESYKFGCSIPWRSARALPIALLAYVSYLCNQKTGSRFDNPAARIATKGSREPFLVRLHRIYNCYVPFSELALTLDQENNEERALHIFIK